MMPVPILQYSAGCTSFAVHYYKKDCKKNYCKKNKNPIALLVHK